MDAVFPGPGRKADLYAGRQLIRISHKKAALESRIPRGGPFALDGGGGTWQNGGRDWEKKIHIFKIGRNGRKRT